MVDEEGPSYRFPLAVGGVAVIAATSGVSALSFEVDKLILAGYRFITDINRTHQGIITWNNCKKAFGKFVTYSGAGVVADIIRRLMTNPQIISVFRERVDQLSRDMIQALEQLTWADVKDIINKGVRKIKREMKKFEDFCFSKPEKAFIYSTVGGFIGGLLGGLPGAVCGGVIASAIGERIHRN